MAALNAFTARLFPSLFHNADYPHRHFIVLTAVLFKARQLSLSGQRQFKLPDNSYWDSLSGKRTKHLASKVLSGCEELENKNPGVFNGALIKLCRSARGAESVILDLYVRPYLQDWSRIPLETLAEAEWRQISEQFAKLHSSEDPVKQVPGEADPLIDELIRTGHCLFVGPVRQNLSRLNVMLDRWDSLKISIVDTSEDIGDQVATEVLLWLADYPMTVGPVDASLKYQSVLLALTSARGDRRSEDEVRRNSELIDMALKVSDTDGLVFAIVADGFLAGSGPELKIRKQLLSSGVVDTVVRLPSALKKRTAAASSLLILNRAISETRRRIHFIDAIATSELSRLSGDGWVVDVLTLYKSRGEESAQGPGLHHVLVDAEQIARRSSVSLDVVDYCEPLAVAAESELSNGNAMKTAFSRRDELEKNIIRLLGKLSAES